MSRRGTDPSEFPSGGRRLILFSVYDADGVVDEFVRLSLEGLRAHADEIVVVVNGRLTPAGRQVLDRCADTVIVRPNEGFDIGGHRDALQQMASRLHEFDEVVMTNDTWYGPVRSWSDVFARMDRRRCHFWGLTDHAAVRPNPVTLRGSAPYHLQSYWIAVRRPLFLSSSWRRYWRDLGPLRTYADAVTRHELRFTEWFRRRGWVSGVAFDGTNYASENPSLFEPRDLIEDGCPVLKRRALFHWPPLLSAYASVGPLVIEAATAGGYPCDVILANLSRTVAPRIVSVACGLQSVVSHGEEVVTPVIVGGEHRSARRLLIIASVRTRAEWTALEGRIRPLRAAWDAPFDLLLAAAEHDLTVAADAFRDISDGSVTTVVGSRGADHALFAADRTVIDADRYDFLLRLADADPIGDARLEELLGCSSTAADIMRLFHDEPRLGIVFAPLDFRRGGRLGNGWRGQLPVHERLASWIGVNVPVDDVTPLAPFGGSYLARPAALRPLFRADWAHAPLLRDDETGWCDVFGTLLAPAAGEGGWHTRTVTSVNELAASHNTMAFQADALASLIPGASYRKIDYLRHSAPISVDSPAEILKMYGRRRYPRAVGRLRRLAESVRQLRRRRHR